MTKFLSCCWTSSSVTNFQQGQSPQAFNRPMGLPTSPRNNLRIIQIVKTSSPYRANGSNENSPQPSNLDSRKIAVNHLSPLQFNKNLDLNNVQKTPSPEQTRVSLSGDPNLSPFSITGGQPPVFARKERIMSLNMDIHHQKLQELFKKFDDAKIVFESAKKECEEEGILFDGLIEKIKTKQIADLDLQNFADRFGPTHDQLIIEVDHLSKLSKDNSIPEKLTQELNQIKAKLIFLAIRDRVSKGTAQDQDFVALGNMVDSIRKNEINSKLRDPIQNLSSALREAEQYIEHKVGEAIRSQFKYLKDLVPLFTAANNYMKKIHQEFPQIQMKKNKS